MRTIAGAGFIALTALAGPGASAPAAVPASPLTAISPVTAAFSPAAADELFGISCVSPRACVAVGLNQNALNHRGGPLTEKWNGKAWKYVAMRLPAGAISGELFGVSCRSASACVAVGLYLDSSDTGIPLAETWDGRAWRPSRLPAPAGSTGVILDGVSCATAKSCVAVGQYFTGTGAAPLAEAWNGRRWTIAKPPVPAGSVVGNLGKVSCPTAAYCVAVGDVAANAGSSVLADSWNGRTWTRMPVRPPASGSADAALDGVSCTSPESCVAVGSGTPGSGRPGRTGFAERWNGSRWTGVSVPWPRGTGNSYLVGVSCAAPRNCVAVGYSGVSVTAGSDTGKAAAVSWQGKAWTVTKVPAPGRGKASLFSDVSCLPAGSCVAAGQVGPASSTESIGLTGFWTGKAWRLVTAL
jgi:hypothetical protein